MPTSQSKKARKAAAKRGAADAYHHGDLRAALLREAGRMLEQDGPAGFSLRDVARRIGVSHNAPYRHFATREDLLGALASEGFRSLGDELAKARGKSGDKGPPIDRMGLAYIEFALANPQRYRLMFGGAKGQSEELTESAKRAFGQLYGSAEARFGDDAAGLAAVRAWAFVHGLAHLLLDKQINAKLMGKHTPLQFAALLMGQSSR